MRSKIIWALLFFFITIPFWMWFFWFITPIKPINILIVDKTVINHPSQEHVSFNWILENLNYRKWDSTFYDNSSDYVGFLPFQNKKFYINGLEKRSNQEIQEIADRLDAVYFTDTYGIYDHDWFGGKVTEKSRKIYGGTSAQDILLLSILKKQKKLIIAEFNCMASPTPRNIRDSFEALFKIRWTGWIGRYFEELDPNSNLELPNWAVDNFQKQHKTIWKFKGQGIILVRDNGQVEVLEYRNHLNGKSPLLVSNSTAQKKYNIPQEVKYPFWFEIIQTSRSNEVISVFKLNTNKRGDSLLEANNILKTFPAVIERNDSGSKMFYFASDFADNPIDMGMTHFRKIEWLKSISINKNNPGERESFFYEYYLPFMKVVLEDYYQTIPKIKKEKINYLKGEK